MKKNLRAKITATLLITPTLSSAVFTAPATAQTAKNATTGTGANGPLLANAVAGKLMVKADVGYVYSFAGDWNKSTTASNGASVGGNTSTATGGVGYGASLGWTSKTGFGLSADYLGFNHKWTGLGTDGKGTEYNYDAPYHVMTITPSYRFKLDSADNWGLRVGLGVGFTLSDINWANKTAVGGAQSKAGTKVAGGAVYQIGQGDDYFCADSIGGSSPVSLTAGQCVSGLAGFSNISSSYNFSDDNNAVDYINYAIGVYFTYQNGTISYALWRQLTGVTSNTDTTNALAKLNSTKNPTAPALTSVSIFESRENYVKRVGATAATAVETRAAAAADEENCLAKGYTYSNGVCNAPVSGGGGDIPVASSGGSAKGDMGVVIAPQVAVEYDSGMLHADLNTKYIHELFNVRYFGSEGSVSGTASSGAITYTSKPGPLALFIGAGLGVNF